MSEHAPLVAQIRRYEAQVLSRQAATWVGVRAELFRRAAIGPSSAEVCLPTHALFFVRRQSPHPAVNRFSGEKIMSGQSGSGHITFVAADCHLIGELPKGTPATDYLALFIEPGQMSRLASDAFDPAAASLRSGWYFKDPILPSLLSGLAGEIERPDQMSGLYADSATLLILTQLVRASTGQPPPIPASRGGLAPYQLKRVTDYIGDRLTDELSLGELADLVGLSAHHFCRVFKQSTGLPPHRWQIQQRVERAKALMLGTDLSLAEIAIGAGFSDQSHFTTVFRKAVGATPNAWRRETRS